MISLIEIIIFAGFKIVGYNGFPKINITPRPTIRKILFIAHYP